MIQKYGDDAFSMIKSNQCVDEAKSVLGGGCGTNASSKKLRENLLSSGKPEPAYKNAAHHIVAGSSPKAAEARAILKIYNIDILDMIREKLLAGIF
ncbi:MAG TPA: hypothetical protein DCL29_02465 [Eubacterium sp.]|nr:hypothetical protein [Eubacterium sp.]